MILARVIGTVVSSRNADQIDRGRYLLVHPADASGLVAETSGSEMVALDAVQADRGQLVLVSQGSSCRQTAETKDRAVDALIVGIVETVDIHGHGKEESGGYQAN